MKNNGNTDPGLIYFDPEYYGFDAREKDVVRKVLEKMHPGLGSEGGEEGMARMSADYLDTLPQTEGIRQITKWLRSLVFPKAETDGCIKTAVIACRILSPFSKKMREAAKFLENIHVSSAKTYEELYNTFTEEERKMTDEYYKDLFSKNYVRLSDEERGVIKRGADLLKGFHKEKEYELLKRFFPKEEQ